MKGNTIDCAVANCDVEINPLTDTHYRIGEEERPVKQLEKAENELEYDDFFSRGWYVCSSCMSGLIDLEDQQRE